MNCEHGSKTAWNETGENKNHLLINLDLTARDIFSAESEEEIRETLDSNKAQIKADIFKTVNNQVLNSIVHKATLDAQGMGQTVEDIKSEVNADIQNNKKTSAELEDGKLRANSTMEIRLDLDSDDDIHPIAALRNAQNILAANIAESVYSNLKKIFFGAGEGRTEGEWDDDGNYTSREAA